MLSCAAASSAVMTKAQSPAPAFKFTAPSCESGGSGEEGASSSRSYSSYALGNDEDRTPSGQGRLPF